MNRKIPIQLRKKIIGLSDNCCEYCRLPDEDSYYGFQIDHVVSIKHDGKTNLQNLAYACPDCNRYKGSDLGTYLIPIKYKWWHFGKDRHWRSNIENFPDQSS